MPAWSLSLNYARTPFFQKYTRTGYTPKANPILFECPPFQNVPKKVTTQEEKEVLYSPAR